MAQLSHYLPHSRFVTERENSPLTRMLLKNDTQIFTDGLVKNKSVVHGDIADLIEFLMEYQKRIALRYHPRRIGFDGNKALVLAINRE